MFISMNLIKGSLTNHQQAEYFVELHSEGMHDLRICIMTKFISCYINKTAKTN